MSNSDRKFFRRWPHREYRVRLAHDDEIASIEQATGRDMTPEPGCHWYTLVRRLADGVRVWTVALHCADQVEVDFTERQAMEIFHAHMPNHVTEDEQQEDRDAQ